MPPRTPTFLEWFAAVAGMTIILTQSKIFGWLREWGQGWSFSKTLLHCPMCMGFWVGALLGVCGFHLLGPELGLAWPLRTLLEGCAGTAACWTLHVVLEHLGAGKL